MKYYKLNNEIYADPTEELIASKGLVEITSPIQTNGTILPEHSAISTLPTDTNGQLHKYYNQDLTPDVAKELLDLQVDKIATIETDYNNANELDIPYMATTFQADKASQDLIVSVLSAGSVPTGFFWVDATNNQVSMTYVELQGLSGSILTRNQTNFVKWQTLKAQIKACSSQVELELIVW